mmetsp:Transcript_5685/g.10196  ORF Transcript_5685/g.10196 Transcript_5685/m.10196 type:complete len:298 (-) Transcript_5685:154-1047(-)|eukprot:CAMPEP_0184525996 /NCGR_PEP_ID=MMETSP0198_2-20121128/10414_1 /TAXON_ID=1112570 /ORGANISM="Thraustochytrium sp., Strain LLF1b" /LENGTH=297 /DNA_ID=CAMNT_0026917529 /DNA_START=187 /DNA_END=1080 /DNA_ORIENTATION=+
MAEQLAPPTPPMVLPVPPGGKAKNRFTSVDLGGKSVLDLSDDEFEQKVAQKIWKHGIICVKGQDLSPGDMKKLAERVGQPLLLPAAFSFENRDPDHMEIVRIGNIKTDGRIVSGVKAAEYWHHDGNFWGQPGCQIVNLLHAKVIPPVGGNTGFMDSSLALAELFKGEEKEKLQKSSCLVSCRWISDFKNAKPEDMLPDVTLPCVPLHPKTHEQCLYVPFTPEGLKDETTGKHWIANDDLWTKIVDAGYTYEHKYEAGDILLWDNLQVMHRSLGGYGDNPRLLFRAQARYSAPATGKL